MKSYSNDTITQDDLNASNAAIGALVQQNISEIDAKQTRQIVLLRWAVGLSFVVNALLAIFL